MSGNPGRTQRIFTAAALKFQRDHYVPFALNHLRRLEILFQQFGLEGKEQERLVRDELYGVPEFPQGLHGNDPGLARPGLPAPQAGRGGRPLARLQQDPQLQKYVPAWAEIAQVQARRAELLRQRVGFSSRLYEIAETLVWMAEEDRKPNSERLSEYRESARASLEQQLFSPAPIPVELERAELADSLAVLAERRGGDDPLVQQVLDGKGPQARAAELIDGTRLADVAVRRRLAAGGQEAINASDDPLIRLARLMEPETRRLRKIQEELQEIERQAYSQVTEALYAIRGTGTYPDATFTLRLAYGTIKGYVENGRQIPPWTTLGGAFAHEQAHGGEPPWKLPPSWHHRRDRLNLETPFNFVCTADIIGGNSGSPVINRGGELVGVIFDGNIQSLTGSYFYSEEPDRAVSVSSDSLLEALREVYDAGQLANELGR